MGDRVVRDGRWDNLDLDQVHLIGIGGVGMSGLARVLLDRGMAVSGSDASDSATVRELRQLGANVFVGHSAAHIGETVDTVVVSTAVRDDNPEVLEARRRSLRLWHRSELLAYTVRGYDMLAVAGTHGKTTTTGLLGHILECSGLDPLVLLGGSSVAWGSNTRLGNGRYAVVESCESDRSFVNYRPAAAIVTNVEAEHLDVYAGLTDVVDAFGAFVALVSPNGCVALGADCPNALSLRDAAPCPVVTFGFDPSADFRVSGFRMEQDRSAFHLSGPGATDLGDWVSPLLGEHYAVDLAGAVSMAMHVGCGVEAIREAVASFRGIRRRFERLGRWRGATVIDDYAHHPTEVRATLHAARLATVATRRIVVFQPHLFSRTRLLLDHFARAFGDADVVLVTEIYGSREGSTGDISGRDLAQQIRDAGNHPWVEFVGGNPQALQRVRELGRAGDLIVTMGAGDVRSIGEALVAEEDSS
ncbi:MAG TPA: UDP-N-acetylmuramate--L-alanine ligase [Armatimonadota bacterium]|nr:UDP-N-acetylmuramate--L-alanine ligase [Armatimonadota bacterium]